MCGLFSITSKCNSAFVLSTLNHSSQNTSFLSKICTAGQQVHIKHAEATVLNSTNTLPCSKALGKTQEHTNPAISFKDLKIQKLFL